jgi:alkylation response protein AidB-like acyl-CoA dehydrogenase
MTTVASVASVVDEARAVAPELSDRAHEGERAGTMPADLVDRARTAGMFRLAMPRELGGLEVEPSTLVEAIEVLSQADGSAGWTVLIGNATAFFAWLDPAVARDLLSGPADLLSGPGDLLSGPGDVVTAACFGPSGRLVPDGSGRHALGGRWPFSSGCRHSDWFANGAFVMDGAAPRVLPDRGPDWRLAFVSARDVQILDDWDAAGLRGTGSNDIAVSRTIVPDECTIAPFFEPARFDGPLYRLPFFTLIGVLMAGLPLGVGRRALDEFPALAQGKVRAGSTDPVAADGDAQVALTRAEGGLRAARSFVFDALGPLWDSALAGDVPSVPQRAAYLLAVQQAMRAGLEAVSTAFEFAGAGAVYGSHPLQRCFRDLNTAKQHIYFAPAAAKRYAKVRLGIDQPTNFF